MWPELERLFGENGACGGCWCMFWRLGAGERYEDVKGEQAKRRFRALVAAGRVHGVLAFDRESGEPVGWCAFDKRVELGKLDRAPSLRVDDAERVWSLPCFFVKSRHRGRGVATALLAAALLALRARGAEIVEAYPTKPAAAGKMAGAWAWTGVPSMFEAAGFDLVGPKATGKQRYRLRVLDR
jgi:GNAT superfamily N-acetyltransferase